MLKIYNSFTKQKTEFKPIKPKHVTLYVCGVTVYDLCHIGHARVFVAFDVITRFLRAAGYQVKFVRNITDIDDKIIKRANEAKQTCDDLTSTMISEMYKDMGALGVNKADLEPKATEYIDKIIELINKLIANNAAYQGENGDVYFNVAAYEKYGQLANKNLDELNVGERVGVASDKKSALDFVLWKQAKPGEPSWSSPWGEGRPGWHIECSAMAINTLGDTIDIHGGGGDLVFPHHENERAQSECATSKTFVNNWLHVGFVNVKDEKMSKSLGNFFTIRDVLQEYHAESVRYFLLASHYRSPVNYSTAQLDAAHHSLSSLYNAIRGLDSTKFTSIAMENHYTEQFFAAMNDDFNTPVALSVLFGLATDLNKARAQNSEHVYSLACCLKYLSGILGLLEGDAEEFFHAGKLDIDVEKLIAERNAARADKNWAQADKIRDELLEHGIMLEDKDGKTIWRKG